MLISNEGDLYHGKSNSGGVLNRKTLLDKTFRYDNKWQLINRVVFFVYGRE
ncbi:MAG: hypothetical protein LBM99_00095 [Bacillales bacterium]|jgi:hypothetical protein|nr:hypothetical protein [Bacillales bacterium]